MQVAGQNMALNIPFSAYGETIILTAQNLVLIGMIWHYNKKIDSFEKLVAGLFLMGYGLILFTKGNFGLIHRHHWDLISSSTSLLNIAARLPQIISNFKNSSTGAMSFVTFFLTFMGSVARLGTAMVDIDDFMIRLPYIVGFVLNLIIMIQFLLYWNSAPKKVQESKAKKSKKE